MYILSLLKNEDFDKDLQAEIYFKLFDIEK